MHQQSDFRADGAAGQSRRFDKPVELDQSQIDSLQCGIDSVDRALANLRAVLTDKQFDIEAGFISALLLLSEAGELADDVFVTLREDVLSRIPFRF